MSAAFRCSLQTAITSTLGSLLEVKETDGKLQRLFWIRQKTSNKQNK